MIALELPEVRGFMSKLLLSGTFDAFLFISGEIVTYNTFTIDGYLKKEFFSADTAPDRAYSLWGENRDFCFSLIRGKQTPLSFKFIFALSAPNIGKLLQQQNLPFTMQDVQGLYLNIHYDGQKLTCVTGTSLTLFTMDKSLEQAWDTMVQKFFTQKEITFELL